MLFDPVVIVSYARTPIGAFQGSLSHLTASELGAHALNQAIQRTGQPALREYIDEVLMGCVLTAGQGQAPARQAAIHAGLPLHTPCTTINKMCGSGMKALMLAHDSLQANSCNMVLAGGMESMSQTPHLLPKSRTGIRMGHSPMIDHMFYDGLEDAYAKGRLMGTFAEECAQHYQFSREAQDDFAIRSLERARQANFSSEIAPMHGVEQDESPQKVNVEKVRLLKPAFQKDTGTVTAANSSSISDGAAALLLMKRSTAHQHQLEPMAEILGHASVAQHPSLFTTAPAKAIGKLMQQTGLSLGNVDLFEINEAFAVVVMAAMHDLQLPAQKVNIFGGACALGHPIGASGARIVCTLINALQTTRGTIGIASACIGGGEATALALRLVTPSSPF